MKAAHVCKRCLKTFFTTAKLFKTDFTPKNLLVATRYFELLTIHEEVATSGISFLYCLCSGPQVSFMCEVYVLVYVTGKMLIVHGRGLPCALYGVVSCVYSFFFLCSDDCHGMTTGRVGVSFWHCMCWGTRLHEPSTKNCNQ